MKNIKILERLYLALTAAVAVIMVFTPLIISRGISIIPEEALEAVVIALLLCTGRVLFGFYRKEVKKNLDACQNLRCERDGLEGRLMEAFRHIGSVNIQIDEVRSAFSGIKKYPENRRDFKNIMQFLGNRVLCMTDSEWVLFRIIDTEKKSTLQEYRGGRGAASAPQQKIGNKALLKNVAAGGYKIISSTQENFRIKAFCVIKSGHVSGDLEILLKAVVNQLEMLFLIFTSNYYRKTRAGKGDRGQLAERPSSMPA